MSEKTNLERLEGETDAVIFGNPKGLNSTDKSMLEMSDTNRLLISPSQSELQIAVDLLHQALHTHDNLFPEMERYQDEQTGNWYMRSKIEDHWGWLTKLDYQVKTNQLVMLGYSRSQHLRQNANSEAVTGELEQDSIWQRLFGR